MGPVSGYLLASNIGRKREEEETYSLCWHETDGRQEKKSDLRQP